MKILITGIAGFIGSNFADFVIDKTNHKIVGLDCLNYASDINNISHLFKYKKRFKFIKGNINNIKLVSKLDFDCVVHFAAETHVTRSIQDSKKFISSDVVGTNNLLIACLKKKLKKFIHISTSEVYGSCEKNKSMDENHPLNPLNPYAAAKCAADRLVHAYGKTYSLPFVIVRPFNNYGPRQHLEKVIPRFITSVISNKNLRIHGSGKAQRDFIHVYDTCNALIKIIQCKKKINGEIINLGSGNSKSIISIANEIINISHYNKDKLFIIDRPGQVERHNCNYNKLKKIINWKPKISFSKGIKETFQWYLNNKQWWRKKTVMQLVKIKMPDGTDFYH